MRNEMTVLEREGYIVAAAHVGRPYPHGSRLPLLRRPLRTRAPGLPAAQRRAVSDFFTLFTSAHRVLEDLLHETSQLLARVSTHTAVVVGPHAEAATVRSVQLVVLQPTLVLALAVLSNGSVEKCVMHLPNEVDDATVATAGLALDARLSGSRWSGLPAAPLTGNPAADALAADARDALASRSEHETAEPVYVGGASRLAAEQEAFPTSTSAARPARAARAPGRGRRPSCATCSTRAPRCRIGSENPIDELRDCSIVVAPYRVDGEVAGTVGVLGPTRMDYRQAVAAVEAISQQLGIVLS